MSAFDGIWNVRLEHASEMETRTRAKALRLTWSLVGQDFAPVYDFVSFSAETLDKLGELERAMRVEPFVSAGQAAALLSKCKGRQCRAVLANKLVNGVDRVKVQAYAPP